MAAIPPIFTFAEMAELSHLCIIRAELVAAERMEPTRLLGYLIGDLVGFHKKSFLFFLVKLAWENGRHSTNIHICGNGRLVGSPYYPCRACPIHEDERGRFLGYRIGELLAF